jgi:hypothetical protein
MRMLFVKTCLILTGANFFWNEIIVIYVIDITAGHIALETVRHSRNRTVTIEHKT